MISEASLRLQHSKIRYFIPSPSLKVRYGHAGLHRCGGTYIIARALRIHEVKTKTYLAMARLLVESKTKTPFNDRFIIPLFKIFHHCH